mgnify:CR=1 FL=1
MKEHDPITATHNVSDQLTGLQTESLDVVAPVRVEVLKENAEGQQESSLDLDALRRTIATAEERLTSVRVLRQQLESCQQEVVQLQQERDQLREELTMARQQLTEVKALQQQLQTLLEAG